MWTKVTIRADYLEKLRILAEKENRSMANMLEVLIDKAK